MKSLTLKRLFRRVRPETFLWIKKGYPVPVPSQIKLNTLMRHAVPDSDWIETGTYLAETAVAIARRFPRNSIFTIEPSKSIYSFSSKKYKKYKNIFFIYGSSEQVFDQTFSRLSGSANLWLDGHYSGDVTYQGKNDSPILHELDSIETELHKFHKLRIFVDDFRLFGNAAGYPMKEVLISWAKGHGLDWTVENDIFIMTLN
jgi:hypothetical protein